MADAGDLPCLAREPWPALLLLDGLFVRRRGFTLLEILILLVVAGILLSIAGPSLATSHRRYAVLVAVRTLKADIAQARVRAILDGATVRVVLDTLAGGYQLEGAGPAPLRRRSLPPGLLLRTTAYRQEILFGPRGTSNLYSTTWIGVAGDPDARWHGVRVIPTGAIEDR